jgi:hypothetical protein
MIRGQTPRCPRRPPVRGQTPGVGGDGGDEAVAAAVDGLDVAGRLRVVAEGLAKEADRFGERRVSDEGVLPHAIEQLLPGDDLAGALEQQLEDPENPRRQRDLGAIAPQQAALRIEREGAETEPHPYKNLPKTDRRHS